MDKITKETIKQLKKEQNYNEIFIRYGSDVYKKYAPNKHKKQDLEKLKTEGKYEAIFTKYGEKEHNKILTKAMYEEIKEESGGFKAFIWKLKKDIKNIAKEIGIHSIIGLSAITATLSIQTEQSHKEHAIQYKNEIENYNEKIEDYAKKVNKMGLNNTQIFMKVMDDMWKSTKGYGNPKKDITGFLELDLATEEGYGVCRNMASDVAKKLNEINPEYNARIMVARIGDEGNYKIADIERKFIETNETVKDNEKQEESEISENTAKKIQKLIGNHAITLVDIPNESLTIVLDPTNPGIGIYMNGKIKMFNSSTENGLDFEAKEYINMILLRPGLEGILETTKGYIKSFEESNLSFEEIEKKYGLEAQNKALAQVRAREKVEKIFEEQYKEKDFKKRYKVDVPGIDMEQTEIGSQEKNINIEDEREQI